MKVMRLNPGQIAPEDSDCIKITEIADGRFDLQTSALSQCELEDDGVSEAVISSQSYQSFKEAERAGLAWAEEHCVGTVYLETA